VSPIHRPAYSGQFAPESLTQLNRVEPIEAVTPDWAWGGSQGAGVKVAVIDSGIDATHPAVGAVSGYMAISQGPEDLVYDPAPHADSYGHGTACAGLIRAVAPECDLYSVKVLGGGLGGSGAVFVAGLRWAIDNGMQVCNLSLGTTKRDFFAVFHELADSAYFHNCMLVTAANNMPVPSFPSVYASVISVASHDEQDPYILYYNPKPPVEFGAPGIDIRLAWLDGGTITGTGNSYAAPHITGLVAKILAKHPDLTIFQMKTVLHALSGNVSAGQPRGPAT
jgi:subtilisin